MGFTGIILSWIIRIRLADTCAERRFLRGGRLKSSAAIRCGDERNEPKKCTFVNQPYGLMNQLSSHCNDHNGVYQEKVSDAESRDLAVYLFATRDSKTSRTSSSHNFLYNIQLERI